jgi:hypothetical protein
VSSWWWLAAWPVTGLTVAATHHVARTAIARRSLMPIIKHNRPVYGLACDGDNCDTVAEHDDGMPIRFDSRDSAADWAREFGWDGPW